ncbi:MAG: nicotinate phosphoribosyltransferase [Clostridia bacterium]|nr:nicotinate phosphoribosyltransferase [Clostridia bacterium]
MNISEINTSMLCDLYEFTMSNGYIRSGNGNKTAVFDLFFRKVPDGGGFAIMAGIEQVLDYIENFRFTEEDIEFLKSKGIFDEKFFDYLRNFKFSCDVYAIPEGTPIFPNEPILTVKGPIIEAQLLETMLLLLINHQSLIATKANRIVRAAEGRPVYEFGSRRAQGIHAAILGARAAYIGGCLGTACVVCEQLYGIPSVGTMAHSWVQMFDSEYEAFKTYAETYPDSCALLIDTYSVLKSGMPNAIKCFDEVLKPLGKRPKAVRIDSGDITYLTRKMRVMLDEAGYPDCKIMASNSLDEYIIRDTLIQGAKIDSFGVGERLITSKSEPVFGGVYKLAAVEENGELVPRIKLSENVTKINIPHFKTVYRLYENQTGKAIADIIALKDEKIDFTQPIEIFDPDYTWKKKVITDYYAKELPVKLFDKGKRVYNSPHVKEIQKYCLKEVENLWEEVTRFENPHTYYVDLSKELWNVKNDLIVKYQK